MRTPSSLLDASKVGHLRNRTSNPSASYPNIEETLSLSRAHLSLIFVVQLTIEVNSLIMASSVDAKLLKSTKFPAEFSQKVDMKKVNVEVMKKWVP